VEGGDGRRWRVAVVVEGGSSRGRRRVWTCSGKIHVRRRDRAGSGRMDIIFFRIFGDNEIFASQRKKTSKNLGYFQWIKRNCQKFRDILGRQQHYQK
jgi:hypothetical protein